MHSSKLLTDLPAELISDISAHLPLVYRPTTLLSLALTCRPLYYVVVPRLLYRDVRLTGEEQALYFLNSSISQLQSFSEANPPLSHYIRHLCIESVIEIPISKPDYSIAVLQKLLDLNGLAQLSALTLHLEDDDVSEEEGTYPLFPPSLWKSLQTRCPRLKKIHITDPEHQLAGEVIEDDIFSFEGLISIGLLCDCLFEDPDATIDFSHLPTTLHILDLHLCELDILSNTNSSLLNCVFPNLRTLILDEFNLCVEPSPTSVFWKNHPGIERLEFGEQMYGGWFDGFEDGMLPNLKYLRCDANAALILLPHVSRTLVGFGVFDTFGAQGTYLLRKVCPGGILPALRSLSIHRHSKESSKLQKGREWHEDALPEHEVIGTSSSDEHAPLLKQLSGHNAAVERKASTIFNGSYIAQIAKAAPELEELELLGTSDESLESLTTSLSLIPNLRRLTFSSPQSYLPFFGSSNEWEESTDFNKMLASYLHRQTVWKYSPRSFDECVKDLANGCPTLEIITAGDKAGQFLIPDGLSARIEREFERGPVRKVRRVKAWGSIIGREEEW